MSHYKSAESCQINFFFCILESVRSFQFASHFKSTRYCQISKSQREILLHLRVDNILAFHESPKIFRVLPNLKKLIDKCLCIRDKFLIVKILPNLKTLFLCCIWELVRFCWLVSPFIIGSILTNLKMLLRNFVAFDSWQHLGDSRVTKSRQDSTESQIPKEKFCCIWGLAGFCRSMSHFKISQDNQQNLAKSQNPIDFLKILDFFLYSRVCKILPIRKSLQIHKILPNLKTVKRNSAAFKSWQLLHESLNINSFLPNFKMLL